MNLELFPERPSEPRFARLPLSVLPVYTGLRARKDLVDDIRRRGLREPIQVAVFGGYHVTTGKRRVDAFRQLLEETGDEEMYGTIPAMIVDGVPPVVQAAESVALHALREENIAAEIDAIEELCRRGASIDEIVQGTHLPVGTVKSRLRLINALHIDLRELFRDGKIKLSVAEAAARLPIEVQRTLVRVYESNGKLTGPDVDTLRRARAVEVKAKLPDSIFSTAAFEAPVGKTEDAIRLLIDQWSVDGKRPESAAAVLQKIADLLRVG